MHDDGNDFCIVTPLFRPYQVVDPVDPRIHFALVCGAKSCPPIKLYSADNLDEGLGGAAEAFCSGEVEVRTGSLVAETRC